MPSETPNRRTQLEPSRVLRSPGEPSEVHRVSVLVERVLPRMWHLAFRFWACSPTQPASSNRLFDDTADVWVDEGFRLVEPLSTVSCWSRPDEFAAVLSEAG